MEGRLITTAVAAGAVGGALLLLAPSPYVDADGFLHEPFSMMMLGRLLLVAALAIAAVVAVMRWRSRSRRRHEECDWTESGRS